MKSSLIPAVNCWAIFTRPLRRLAAMRSNSPQHLGPGLLPLVVSTLFKRLKFFQPQLFQQRELLPVVPSCIVARRKLVHYFKSKVTAAELVPIRLKLFVRMIPILQLKFVPINYAGEIQADAQKYSIVDVVAYQEYAHWTRGLQILLL